MEIPAGSKRKRAESKKQKTKKQKQKSAKQKQKTKKQASEQKQKTKKQKQKTKKQKQNAVPRSITTARPVRVGTWCSGLESIVLALLGLGINICHVFAADINKTAQADLCVY